MDFTDDPVNIALYRIRNKITENMDDLELWQLIEQEISKLELDDHDAAVVRGEFS